MPSQPEASTLPLALEFRDINLVIEPFNMSGPSKIIKESAPGVLNNVDLNIYDNSIKLK